MSDLTNFFTTSSFGLKHCRCVCICENKSHSGFLFHHLISYYLKQDYTVVLLSFSQSFNHFNTVGNKTGTNLTEETKNSKFMFIEGLKHLGNAVNCTLNGDGKWRKIVTSSGNVDVKQLYEIIKTEINLSENCRNLVLIIDNISILLDIGVPLKDLIAFLQYIRKHVCRREGGCLITGLNNDCGIDDDETSGLWKVLQYESDLTVQVNGLESGYCHDVHGQVCGCRNFFHSG